jgi:hypothetical protein
MKFNFFSGCVVTCGRNKKTVTWEIGDDKIWRILMRFEIKLKKKDRLYLSLLTVMHSSITLKSLKIADNKFGEKIYEKEK